MLQGFGMMQGQMQQLERKVSQLGVRVAKIEESSDPGTDTPASAPGVQASAPDAPAASTRKAPETTLPDTKEELPPEQTAAAAQQEDGA